jgi:hypothetical protein
MIKIISSIICSILIFFSNTINLQASPFNDFDGIIFGDNVNMRISNDPKSKVLAAFTTGQKFRILSMGDPVSIPGIQGEYPWYQISINGKTGWVYGKFVYDLAHDTSSWYVDGSALRKGIINGNQITIQKKIYYFGVVSGSCYDVQTGPDSNSSAGQCAIPFLYGKDDKKFVFFKNPKDFCGKKIPNHTPETHIEGDYPGGIFRLVDKTPFGSDQIESVTISQKAKNILLEMIISTGGNGFSGKYSLKGIFKSGDIELNSCGIIEWDEIK